MVEANEDGLRSEALAAEALHSRDTKAYGSVQPEKASSRLIGPFDNGKKELHRNGQGEDDETESSEESDGGSDFDEDACSFSEQDLSTEIPLTDDEIQGLIDELLVVESKAAEAQELLEEESLAALKDEVKAELAAKLSGSELDTAVEEEMCTYVEQWQETLDELEDQSGLLQERLDDAGVDLSDLFKWIEKQAPQGCTTEAWKKRTHWAGLYASDEVTYAIRKAENDLELLRPVKRQHGRFIEEGASGFLEKRFLHVSASTDGSQIAAQRGDGWESIDALFGNEGNTEKLSGFGTEAWASVYMAATPEQAALLGLPGADQVEEIVDLDKCKKDFLTATALASEKETGLTEQQKKNLKKVGEEDDIKKAKLMDSFILKRKKKKKTKVSCSTVGPSELYQFAGGVSEQTGAVSTSSFLPNGAAFYSQTNTGCEVDLDKTEGMCIDTTLQDSVDGSCSERKTLIFGGDDCKLNANYLGHKNSCIMMEQDTQKEHLKRHREVEDSDFCHKRLDKVVIDIDSDEEQVSEKTKQLVYGQEQAILAFSAGESDTHNSKMCMDLADVCSKSIESCLDNDGKTGIKDNEGNGKLANVLQSSNLSQVGEGVENIAKKGGKNFMCTICGEDLRCDQVHKHPVFDVAICKPCRQFYQSGPFTKDSNGSYNECCWCANGGDVLICSLCDKVFCTSCITLNFGEQEVERILNAKEWFCYCCNSEPMKPKIECFRKANEVSLKQFSDHFDSDGDELSELRSKEKRRKRLRRILEDDELEESTILKQRLEKERQERLDRLRESANTTSSSVTPVNSTLQECPINVARDVEEEEVLIPFGIAKFLKPHQIEGVRFMWENCIESLQKVKAGDAGNGCILAHNMGLGKTLQVIAFLYTVFRRKDLGFRTALIVTPVNVLHNWPDEFEKWKPPGKKKLRVFVLDETTRNIRKAMLNLWQRTGGVMMVGYTAFRTMSMGKHVKDAHEREAICEALQNPGPDILVCDEAHMIKNKKSDITQALKQVKTQRRIALTGSPLQNNLMEYYCMVDFVREGFLGRPQDFKNRFQNPIQNGQHADSTEYDVKCMKERTHVLHKQLMGFVQRKGANVVEKELPKKYIYVLSVRLSHLQRALYNRFIQLFWLTNEQGSLAAKCRKSLFPTYHALAKVWNHPDLLFYAKEERDVLSDDSMDDILCEDDGLSSNDGNNEAKKEDKRSSQRSYRRTESESMMMIEGLDWCKDLISDKPQGMLENSGKLVLLLDILSMSSARCEKALVFSQSIPTLNLIESFLEKMPRPGGKPGYWRKDKEWYRLDGQTKARERQKLVKRFNDPCNSKVQCALISTKAGSLGINLQAANRVVILDGSWNPTHDIQALFRAWRFGQKKPVVVYRLLAYGTAEEKIYKRQVAKEGLAARVLDAQQVGRHSKMEELKVLFKLDDDAIDPSENRAMESGQSCREIGSHLSVHGGVTDHDAPEDEIMTSLLIDHRPKWIVRIHQHETLLVDREDEKLTLEEQALAWEKFRRITENTNVEWVQVNSEPGDTSTSHVHNSWTNTFQAAPLSSCSAKFHAELLASSDTKNNEHVKCVSCQQSIGWEHIVKGRQFRGTH